MFYSQHSFVVGMQYHHHHFGLDPETFWKDWGTACPFWFSQEAKIFLFPLKWKS